MYTNLFQPQGRSNQPKGSYLIEASGVLLCQELQWAGKIHCHIVHPYSSVVRWRQSLMNVLLPNGPLRKGVLDVRLSASSWPVACTSKKSRCRLRMDSVPVLLRLWHVDHVPKKATRRVVGSKTYLQIIFNINRPFDLSQVGVRTCHRSFPPASSSVVSTLCRVHVYWN